MNGYNATPTSWWYYAWNNLDETLTSITDPESNKVEFAYLYGQISSIKTFPSEEKTIETTYTYADDGLLSTVTNANGHWVDFYYDSYGFPTSTVPQMGPIVNYAYSPLGHLTNISMLSESGPRVTEMDVNELGRVTEITYPDNSTETFMYSPMGNLTNHVDAAGRTNSFTYLPTRKLASATSILTGITNQEVTTSLVYDQQFNTLNIADALGRDVEAYVLDIQDRPITVTNVEGQTMSLSYGIGDYVKSVTRFDGTVVSNEYTADGQLYRIKYPDSTNTLTYYSDGLIKTVMNEAGIVSNEYDLANRLIASSGACPPDCEAVGRVNYYLDDIGNPTNIVVSVDGAAVLTNTYAFDVAERISEIDGQGGNFKFNYGQYNGLVAGVSNTTSGVHVEYDFDNMNKLTNIVWRNATNGVIRSFGYQYSDAGMITNVTRETEEHVVYWYDSLDRLTGETLYVSGGGVSNQYAWTYDLVGNRTQSIENGATNVYTLGIGNKLASFGTTGTVLHDTAGNITNIVYNDGRELDLEWNGSYQLVSVSTDGVLAEKYTYGPLGRRLTISDGTTTNWMIHSGSHIIAEVDDQGDLVRSYQHGSGTDNLLSMTVYTGAVAKTYYALTDNLGTIHAWADEDGDIVEQYKYTAWGEVSVFDGSGGALTKSVIGNRFTFQGREFSWVTGLMHFRARSYVPRLGRWCSLDPIGISGGLNQRVFCGNNPANFVDPSGTDLLDWSANFFGGFADVVSFGLSSVARKAGGYDYVDRSTVAYKGGRWTGEGYSLALGGARLAYAGSAKVGSKIILRQGATRRNALKAWKYRNSLKKGFNLGVKGLYQRTPRTFMRNRHRQNWAKWIKAAGHTASGRENRLLVKYGWNYLGGYFAAAGIKGIVGDNDSSDSPYSDSACE